MLRLTTSIFQKVQIETDNELIGKSINNMTYQKIEFLENSNNGP